MSGMEHRLHVMQPADEAWMSRTEHRLHLVQLPSNDLFVPCPQNGFQLDLIRLGRARLPL